MKHPKAHSADNVHQMPVRRTVAVGRLSARMVRVTEILADTAEERAWCERVRADFAAAGIVAEIARAPGMIAVYREVRRSRLPLFSRHVAHRAPPATMVLRALVETWDATRAGAPKRLVQRVERVEVLARRYRCSFCGRVFLLDAHGAEYVESGGMRGRGASVVAWTHEHTGRNKHSRCCVECLPQLCALLPMCDVDAEMDRRLELWGVREG